MNLIELKKQVREYQYLEDEGMIDVALAAIVATRLELGDPVWLILIGASSGGKSQILRPLAMTDEKFIHRIDDLTENTFLSGSASKEGEISLLKRIGPLGIIVISDLSVIFSKAVETRAAILSQFRMIYDGEMTKFSGSRKEGVHWKGSLGILAGATPGVYRVFEEVSDMGERFMFYRMKEYGRRAAAGVFWDRKTKRKALDIALADLYEEYVKTVVGQHAEKPEGWRSALVIGSAERDRIIDAAIFAEKVRTVAHMEWKGQHIDDIPITAYPMRTIGQLQTIAMGMIAMRMAEAEPGVVVGLAEKDVRNLEWCAYSLANEKKRLCLKAICSTDWDTAVRTQTVADAVGLNTDIVNGTLQVLAAVGVLSREGDGGGLLWKMTDKVEWSFVRRMEGIGVSVAYAERELSSEDGDEAKIALDTELDMFGVVTPKAV